VRHRYVLDTSRSIKSIARVSFVDRFASQTRILVSTIHVAGRSAEMDTLLKRQRPQTKKIRSAVFAVVSLGELQGLPVELTGLDTCDERLPLESREPVGVDVGH
jgi:hypothetical protein